MGMLKWQPKEFITCWLKAGSFIYPGEDTTGSGLDEIESYHKTEIKLQTIIKF